MQFSWLFSRLLVSYFCSRGSNFRISVRVILLTGFKSHQIHPCYFKVFIKFIPVWYFWATASHEGRVRTRVRAGIIAWPTGEHVGTVSINGVKAGCKQEKVVRFLGVDLTQTKNYILCQLLCPTTQFKGKYKNKQSSSSLDQKSTYRVAWQRLPRGSSYCFLGLLLVR